MMAQVGINTTTPQAQLDIPATNAATPSNTDGILIPRIDVFPTTNPTASQNGMLVFLTTTAGLNQPGFYYWNNGAATWQTVGGNINSYWKTTGNSGTTAGPNFIGTTDNVDFVLKRNNLRAGFLGNPAISGGNKNTAFGANALNVAATGSRNTALGTNTLQSNTTGFVNVAVGDQSMYFNTTGNANTAIGNGSLYYNLTGRENTALGRNSLVFNNSGNYNTAAGYSALYLNVSGANNTGLGYEALYSALGSNNVGVGYQSGYFETGSNKLYIENSSADADNALIYGEFDTNIVRTNGTLQIGNPAGAGYAFPSIDGIAGQTLITNGTGLVSWSTPTSMSVMRSVRTVNQTLATTGWQKINFNSPVFDTNAEFNPATSRYVATVAGLYKVNAAFHTNNQSNGQFYSIAVYVNSVLYQQTSGNHFGNGPVMRTVNCMVNLPAGAYVEIFAENYQAGVDIDSFSGKSFFEVQRIR